MWALGIEPGSSSPVFFPFILEIGYLSLCNLDWPQTHSASESGLTDTAFTSGLPEHLNNNVQSRWDCKGAKTTMAAGESEFETEAQRVRKAAFVTVPDI